MVFLHQRGAQKPRCAAIAQPGNIKQWRPQRLVSRALAGNTKSRKPPYFVPAALRGNMAMCEALEAPKVVCARAVWLVHTSHRRARQSACRDGRIKFITVVTDEAQEFA